MRRLVLLLTLLMSVEAQADQITGVQGFEYKAYRTTSSPKDLAKLRVGSSSAVSCDALGFTTDYSAVWDNVKNVADQVVDNKKTLLLGAAQYLLAKVAPSLYSVLSKVNSMAQAALKYNFDACALYKKAQEEASKNGASSLSALCMSVVGDPDVCSAPGKALKAVFGKGRVDVVDEIVKNPEVADLVKAVVGTVVFEASGGNLETSYYSPAWRLADIYSVFYKTYYDKYREIAEKVHDGKLDADSYYKNYAPWITIGGEIDLKKVRITSSAIDLSDAKSGGYQIPYDFFYQVAHFTPAVAFSYVNQMAQYAAVIDLQALLTAIQKELSAGGDASGKGGVLKNKALLERVEKQYRDFARTFGEPTRENVIALEQSAASRYKSLVAESLKAPATERTLLESVFEGPPKPR